MIIKQKRQLSLRIVSKFNDFQIFQNQITVILQVSIIKEIILYSLIISQLTAYK